MPETTPKTRRVRPRATLKTPAILARTPADREAIKADGGQISTLADFLGLGEVEMRTIDLRIGLTEAIIRLRGEAKMTQAALAKILGLSRPRIAEIEARKPNTSFDNLIPVFFAVGGTSEEFAELVKKTDESMNY